MVTYDYRAGYYLTLIDGRVEEAHRDLTEFVESLETLNDRRRA
jgi:hypothetical protein